MASSLLARKKRSLRGLKTHAFPAGVAAFHFKQLVSCLSYSLICQLSWTFRDVPRIMVLGSFGTILTVLAGITALDRLFPSVRFDLRTTLNMGTTSLNIGSQPLNMGATTLDMGATTLDMAARHST